ncbi:MAG: NUDIX domain-containing protein [Alphaproteobacteria bacterium]|nr:MAG: NUDIX domain-containing protein [Alphaproteobacteria bacterium]
MSKLEIFMLIYDENVGVVLIKDKLIFVGKRKKQGTWQMPQGNVDSLESPFEAASRELYEEIGVSNVEWVGETGWRYYNFPEYVKKQTCFANKKGKKQKWFYALLYEECTIKLGDEFCDYQWIQDEWIRKNIIGFKRNVYNYVFDHEIYQRIKFSN